MAVSSITNRIEPDYDVLIKSLYDQLNSLRDIYDIHMLRIVSGAETDILKFVLVLDNGSVNFSVTIDSFGDPDVTIGSLESLSQNDISVVNDVSQLVTDSLTNQ